MAVEPVRRQSPWRFSLAALMAATAFAALLAWLYTQLWRLDDLIYLALWSASVVTGVACRRAARGIVIAALLGGLLPFAGYMAYHLAMFYVWRMVQQSEAFFRTTQLAIVTMGALSAATIAAMSIGYRSLDDRVQPMARRGAALAIAFVLGAILTVEAHRYAYAWRPFLTLPLVHAQGHHPTPPAIAFSADGSLLAVAAVPSAEQQQAEVELRIWDIRTGKLRPPLMVPRPRCLCFAPDGKNLVVVRDDGFCVLDLSTGQLANNINAPTANPWISQNCAFSPDGKSFVASIYDDGVLKANVWDTASWTVREEHVLSQTALPVVAGHRLALLQYTPAKWSNIALTELETQSPLFPVRHSLNVYHPLFHENGSHVVVGHSILNLETGQAKELPGPVMCLARSGKCGVMRRCDMRGHRFERLPDWRLGLPVVRHWWRTRHYIGQIVLVDLATGNEVCVSPNYFREYFSAVLASPDGKIIVGTCSRGRTIRIWRVPD